MKTNNKKKSIIKRLLAFTGATFCAILCAFSLFNISDNKSMEVSADEVITTNSVFNGSPLIVPTSLYIYSYNSSGNRVLDVSNRQNSSTSYFRYLYSLFNVSFQKDISTGNLLFSINLSSINLVDSNNTSSSSGHQSSSPYSYINYMDNTYSGYFYNDISNINWLVLNSFSTGKDLIISNGYYTGVSDPIYGICLEINKSSIDIDVSKITSCTISQEFSDDRTRFIIEYLDVNSNFVQFRFANGLSDYSFPTRTYYFNDNYIFTDNEYYNQGFASGQSSGYNSGYSAGEKKGYSDGYNVGKNDGYWLGREEADENEYSFTSLITSVVDVPVKTFTSLFNFEILGVNLSGFLLGLFTISVAIFIIKLLI